MFLIKQGKKILLKYSEPAYWDSEAHWQNSSIIFSQCDFWKNDRGALTVLTVTSTYWVGLFMQLCKKTIPIFDRKLKSNFAFVSYNYKKRVHGKNDVSANSSPLDWNYFGQMLKSNNRVCSSCLKILQLSHLKIFIFFSVIYWRGSIWMWPKLKHTSVCQIP